ncbi:MAG: deoxyribodipyrimidine photo-lyase [Phycisphaeraceae bacterium]|nr:deoxyribodipyrimidine photo-lyase [Phycisphaeraceae bacterium]MCW5762111.1 deoxyribodipyrimidine photo-lyase [Phycisphaeraceae bacterium]
MRSLIWFRSDLRCNDNTALDEAARRSTRGVVAAFAVTPRQWLDLHHWSASKLSLVLRSVSDLSEQLATRNIALRIITQPDFAALPKALLDLARSTECDALFFNREYEWNERQRDALVSKAFLDAGLAAHSFTDRTLFEPGQIRTKSGTHYTVYSPFKRAAHTLLAEGLPTLRSTPKKRAEMVSTPDPVPNPHDLAAAQPHDALWPEGEAHVRARLDRFAQDALSHYHARRDLLAEPGTSTLSPYLAIGAISIRRCAAVALDMIGPDIDKGPPGPTTWLSELLWREFYTHVLFNFPRVSKGLPFRLDTQHINWDHNPDHLAAWKAGRTGYPIVDAAMRQLLATGWMHNRARMIAAMFLTKDLGLDWRLGEQHFMQHLVDGDLANNNGGWQWSASTGTDAQPYFRIFNPITQSQRFDPQGHYIRRYVHEIAHLDDHAIHDPSSLGLAAAALDYPPPIVDHAAARARTLARFTVS